MRAKRPPQLRGADDGPKKEADDVSALQERFGWSEEETTTHSGIVVELRTRYHGGLWSIARVNSCGIIRARQISAREVMAAHTERVIPSSRWEVRAAAARRAPQIPRSASASHSRRSFQSGWDSNPVSSCRICNLQILSCQGCQECRRCRGALLDFTHRRRRRAIRGESSSRGSARTRAESDWP